MNASIIDIVRISLDSSIIIASSIGSCLSLFFMGTLLVHVVRRRHSPNRVPLLLTANMHLAIGLFCLLMLDTYARSLNKRFNPTSAVEDDLPCRFRAYFMMAAVGGIFYSNMLQALFRLCRIIFYTRPRLQQFNFYATMIVLQWIVCCLWMVPNLLLRDFEYFPNDFQCQISFFNRRGLYYNVLVSYLIPITVIIASYVYTVRKTRRMTQNLQHDLSQIQLAMARRDTIVLLRICILPLPMVFFSVPSAAVYIIHVVDGYQPWWGVPIEWISCVLSMICVNFILAHVSPQIRNMWPSCKFAELSARTTTVSTVEGRAPQRVSHPPMQIS